LEDIEFKSLFLDEEESVSPFMSGSEEKPRKIKQRNFNKMIGSLRIDTDDRLYTLESETKKILATNESNLLSDISPKKNNLSF
jgi:hypothetical protein